MFTLRTAILGSAAAALLLVANPASALQVGTRCFKSPGLLGIADGVPTGDLTDRIDNVDGGGDNLINTVKDDDALGCVLAHGTAGLVDTSAEWLNELANTASHEIGHLLSLRHIDDVGSDDLMDGPYDGTNKSFDATPVALLNGLANADDQLVWIDFEAESTELPVGHAGFGLSIAPQLALLGIVDIAAAKATILAAIKADYNAEAAYTGGFNATFTATKPLAGTYATFSFVVPEPSTLLLLTLGLLGLSVTRRRRSG